MFNFFLNSYRKSLLDFCGSKVEVEYDPNGPDCKECFRKFEDGYYKNKIITSRHPNIVKGVIIGKKSWGLWKNEWSDGIVEGSFLKREILHEFEDKNLKIPEPLLEDFENTIYKKEINKMKKLKDHG